MIETGSLSGLPRKWNNGMVVRRRRIQKENPGRAKKGIEIITKSLIIFVMDKTKGALAIRHHPDLQWSNLVKMHIALREGNSDTRLAEFTVDSLIQLVQHRYPVIDTIDENPQFEIQAVVAKPQENSPRFRSVENQSVGFSGLEQQFLGQQGIGTIGDADGNFNSDNIIGQ